MVYFLNLLFPSIQSHPTIIVKIAQFLDLKDLSNVSRVSKSLYNFVESERIWSDQFHLNWKSKYIDDKISRSYKEKCKKAYHDSFDKRLPEKTNHFQFFLLWTASGMRRKKTNFWGIIT